MDNAKTSAVQDFANALKTTGIKSGTSASSRTPESKKESQDILDSFSAFRDFTKNK